MFLSNIIYKLLIIIYKIYKILNFRIINKKLKSIKIY